MALIQSGLNGLRKFALNTFPNRYLDINLTIKCEIFIDLDFLSSKQHIFFAADVAA